MLKEAGQALEHVQFDEALAERIRARYARLFPPTLDLTEPAIPLAPDDASLLGPDDIQRATTTNGIPCEFRGYALDTLAAEIQGVLVNADSRVRDPLYHVVLSWPSHEQPTDEQAFACARHAIEAVGMADHQYLSAIHRDTDNTHVHIAVNRVHPDSYRAVYPKQDFFVLDRAMRELELKYGWSHDAGPYVVADRNGVPVIERARPDASTQEKMPSAAADLERFTGEVSFFTYVRGQPRKEILALWKTAAPAWDDLHAVLAKHGLALRPKGQGFAIYDTQNENTPPIKASDMHESLSRTRLERRLGAWVEPAVQSVDELPAPPAQAPYDRRRELKRDPAQREARRQERADARRQLRADHQAYRAGFIIRRVSGDESRARYQAIVDAARARRRDVAQTVRDPRQRKALYSVIAFETLTARETLKAELARRRAELRADPNNRPLTYREWVEAQAAAGSAAAISQLRGWSYADTRRQAEARRQHPGIADPTAEHDPAFRDDLQDWQPAVHRDGRISYRDRLGREGFVDHGQHILLEAAASADHDVILAALSLAQERYQGRFVLTGTPEFQHQVLQLIAQQKLKVSLLDPDQARRLAEITRSRSVARPPGRSSP
ncbi:TraI/MobA(P) family conjugative relaxase [Achromobacter xylosoxidans]